MRHFMKALFQNKISVKQIKEIEKEIIVSLKSYDENFEKIYLKEVSEISNIVFSFKPKGISLMREIKKEKEYLELKKTFNEILNITGIEFYNKKTKAFQNIPCSFSNYQLSFIEFENPEKFHKILDISKVVIKNLEIQKVPIINPDKEIVEKILNIRNKKEIEKLDLEYCFEIEYENKKFYTILDFENGNYIATDKNGKIYFLDHTTNIGVKKIHENIVEFLTEFDGNKFELEEKL